MTAKKETAKDEGVTSQQHANALARVRSLEGRVDAIEHHFGTALNAPLPAKEGDNGE